MLYFKSVQEKTFGLVSTPLRGVSVVRPGKAGTPFVITAALHSLEGGRGRSDDEKEGSVLSLVFGVEGERLTDTEHPLRLYRLHAYALDSVNSTTTVYRGGRGGGVKIPEDEGETGKTGERTGNKGLHVDSGDTLHVGKGPDVTPDDTRSPRHPSRTPPLRSPSVPFSFTETRTPSNRTEPPTPASNSRKTCVSVSVCPT